MIIVLTCIWSVMLIAPKRKKFSYGVQRTAFALSVAVTAAMLAWSVGSRRLPTEASDLAPIWASARAWLDHQDPYDAVGPGRTFDTSFPQIYPMTAIVTVTPLALIPLRWSEALFVGLGFGLFTWAATTKRLLTPAVVALVSLGALMAIQTSQWSLLLTGAALVPGFGWLLVAKPTVGLALFAAFPRWKTAIGCGVFLLLATLLWPAWITEWRATLASAPHVIPPVTRKVGPFVL